MKQEKPNTYYAPAEREDAKTLKKQRDLVLGSIHGVMFDAIPDVAIIINERRQIIAFNQHFLDMLGDPDHEDIIGVRPGELFHCVNAHDGPGGCGTSRECRDCGGVQAILGRASGVVSERELNLLTKGKILSAYDMGVKAVPMPIDGQEFTLVFMKDISSFNRRKSMERLFFHDTMNAISGLRSLAYLFKEELTGEHYDFACKMDERVLYLQQELESFKSLTQAEYGTLEVKVGDHRVMDFLQWIADYYQESDFCSGKEIRVLADLDDVDRIVRTDKNLLTRVVLNLMKNALEAAMIGDIITLSVTEHEYAVRFSVHNPQYMAPSVRHQVFHRSYSTKGADRGLGTYSAKLFTENFLGGSLNFTSTEENGTTFTVITPDIE